MLLCALELGYWSMHLLAPAALNPPMQPYTPAESTPASGWRTLFEPNAAPQGVALQLHGVVLGAPEDSMALVSVNGARARPVRVGQDIAPGLRLVGVTLYNASITRNGLKETLPLMAHINPKLPPALHGSSPNAPPAPPH